jgi:maltooligosyltrehalose trehalohydrolase
VPRQRFIVAAQNHDQIGNRPNGERLASLVPADRARLAAALVLLSPYIPLLFMGEEYGETAPFMYFIEHGDPDLVEAVRAGRRKEFAEIGKLEQQIDPQARETFERCKLDWSQRTRGRGAQMLQLYTDLLALRREEPALRPGMSVAHVEGSADWCTVLRTMPLQGDIFDAVRAQRTLWYAFNLSGRVQHIPVPEEATSSWRLRLGTDAVDYGGTGLLIHSIPAVAPENAVNDAPKRLLEIPLPSRHTRTVPVQAWSAVVYVSGVDEVESAR